MAAIFAELVEMDDLSDSEIGDLHEDIGNALEGENVPSAESHIYSYSSTSIPLRITALRRIFQDWKMGKSHFHENYITYVLQHKYTNEELQRGAACLRDRDADKLSLLHAVSDLGYTTCIANLERHVVKSYPFSLLSDGINVVYAPDYTGPEFDDDVEEMFIKHMVDLNGNSMFDLRKTIAGMCVNEDTVVPKGAFDGARPDRTYREMNGDEMDHNFYYNRTVLVIFLQERLFDVLMEGCRMRYMLARFKESISEHSPTDEDKRLATVIIKNIRETWDDEKSATTLMLEHAFKWKDVDMWREIIRHGGRNIVAEGKHGLVRALREFGFYQIRFPLDTFLSERDTLHRFEFIDAIYLNASKLTGDPFLQEWRSKQMTLALESCVSPHPKSVPILASFASQNGIQALRKLRIETDNDSYQFLIELVRSIHSKTDDILLQTTIRCRYDEEGNAKSRSEHLLNEFIEKCFGAAIEQWNSGTPQEELLPPRRMDDRTETEEEINSLRLNRISEIAELCIATRQMDVCARLFDLIRRFKTTDAITKANSVYIPLISRLLEILRRTNTGICTYPLDLFLESTVSGYVKYVLGTKEHNPIQSPPRIGCMDSGCSLCHYVDSFIIGSDRRRTFRVPNELQEHLKRQIRLSNGVVSLVERDFDDRNVTLEIIKSPVTYAATSWQGRCHTLLALSGERPKNQEKHRSFDSSYLSLLDGDICINWPMVA
ncbi:hypothetical protein M378DRAFT_166864 [Amanita muscaria Koide BX008]|uniref:Uncharacterized protein n=1 Tax=Amanita muscaria (strain Koide BX008) TaxID=946122 RepID=A0A0C2WYE3_AMAMK|nr:hypothetical protein M378DRAFT_166864 [Amanita muscaria Koide BX008]